MSATYIGYEGNDLIVEKNYEVDKVGVVNYTERILVPPLTNIVTPSLEKTITIGARKLRAVAINVTSSGGGFTEVVTNYQGDSGGVNTLQQDATNATGEEPIATNRNFLVSQDGAPSIVDLSGGTATLGSDGTVAGTGGALFDSDGGFLYFRQNAQKNFFGISSYLNPSLMYRRQFSTIVTPSLSAIGRIVKPDDDFPSVTQGATWLCMSLAYQTKGKTWDVTQEFKASGPNGWNEYIYGPAVTAPPTN